MLRDADLLPPAVRLPLLQGALDLVEDPLRIGVLEHLGPPGSQLGPAGVDVLPPEVPGQDVVHEDERGEEGEVRRAHLSSHDVRPLHHALQDVELLRDLADLLRARGDVHGAPVHGALDGDDVEVREPCSQRSLRAALGGRGHEAGPDHCVLVAQVLEDHLALAERGAVLADHRRHLPLRAHLQERLTLQAAELGGRDDVDGEALLVDEQPDLGAVVAHGHIVEHRLRGAGRGSGPPGALRGPEGAGRARERLPGRQEAGDGQAGDGEEVADRADRAGCRRVQRYPAGGHGSAADGSALNWPPAGKEMA